MITTVYKDFTEVNKLQTDIMMFVDAWVHLEKTPVPQKKIILHMRAAGIKTFTTVWALNSLMRKGFIRRSCMITNKTFYVQLRRV